MHNFKSFLGMLVVVAASILLVANANEHLSDDQVGRQNSKGFQTYQQNADGNTGTKIYPEESLDDARYYVPKQDCGYLTSHIQSTFSPG